MLKIPPRTSIYFKICRSIFYGSTTTEKILSDLNGVPNKKLKRFIYRLVSYDYASHETGKWELSAHVQTHFNDTEKTDDNIVPAKQVINKPWSGKYSISAHAKRDDAPEFADRYYLVSGTVTEPKLRGI